MSFRTDYAYEEFLRESEGIDSEDCYDELVNNNDYYSYARCGTDEEMEEFRESFKALNAEEKFIECCIDYYKDVNTELKVSIFKLKSKLKVFDDKESSILPFDKKMKRFIRNRRRPVEANYDLTLSKKTQVEKKLTELRKSLKRLKEARTQTEIIK